MIKIVRVEPVAGSLLRLEFSDGTAGEYDVRHLVDRDTELTRPLREPGFFASVFLELGALAWPNGLELSPSAVHRELEEKGALRRVRSVA
ncbi:DUF2442 domain-containing protein [Acidobacteria bacterium ACD]|nr:MAG: DUF2442 domain-containing protein [Acidobacteriota bacterium]MCE7957738.1 DUF2442 domain-containing protein [Acidobacteria bacterium ACB2]MDL1948442.1 DUF2442 domain-containing protein [Acidobacteria bacterium ACD]